ncbi:MAG: bifunctional 4-hydroxy-2-oxoglutarate aldolase/2-dehydro-3-deoxy-phosphogluconate aldolase [Bacteroidia bacterium]|nr:bifunctional 4-hydroxy-2-oxoglutarate aldolase/2-dehydro-3-deoxy-phosphogluconate aldolase [Bacteroidia bacterium]
MNTEIFEVIRKIRLMPVIKLTKVEDALKLADALEEGNLPIAEVTYRTNCASEAIKLISKKKKNILVGAGTVLTIAQAKEAIESGAKYIVTPGFNDEIVDFAISVGVPIIPGVTTPTEVEMALKRNLKVLKFFPAEASGGIEKLKALGAVYDVKFVPTGGIGLKNLKDYLSLANVLACGGSWMVNPSLIEEGAFDQIVKLTKEATALALA